MRMALRLAALAALLVVLALAVIYLRTDTTQAASRLHALFGQKRGLERQCLALGLETARLRNQERLRQEAAQWPAMPQASPTAPCAAGPPRQVAERRVRP